MLPFTLLVKIYTLKKENYEEVEMKIKHYLLVVISLVLFQGCLCKHYPFEKLKSEVGEPLHKQIMEYKKKNGIYPSKKDKKIFGEFLKNMGCKFQSRAEIYPEAYWLCNESKYIIFFAYTKPNDKFFKTDKSGFREFTIRLGEFTSCWYDYDGIGFNYSSCYHSPCWSRYTH